MLKPIKSLGQHYLRDENILRKITGSLSIEQGDVFVEIGPGQGALTKHLVDKPIILIGIEVDKRAIELLRQTVGEKLILIHEDVLNVDLNNLSKQYGRQLRIVGNIPYYLTSEILFWLFDARSVLVDSVIMMQLEVAQRLVANPGNKDYGILSIFTQFYTECKLLFKVSRNCFFPRPEVDSAIIKMNFKEQLPECDEKLFRTIVRATFSKRRKTLKNGLKSLDIEDSILNQLDLNLTRRPEDLSIGEFVSLANAIDRIKKQ